MILLLLTDKKDLNNKKKCILKKTLILRNFSFHPKYIKLSTCQLSVKLIWKLNLIQESKWCIPHALFLFISQKQNVLYETPFNFFLNNVLERVYLSLETHWCWLFLSIVKQLIEVTWKTSNFLLMTSWHIVLVSY